MPTQDILVPIDFGGGIDQTADPKRTIPTKLTDLRNARLEYGKRISKRYGMRKVAQSLDQFTGVALVGDVMAALGDQVLVHSVSSNERPDTLYVVGANASGFGSHAASLGDRNLGATLEATRFSIQPQTGDSTLIDSASIGAITVIAYEESFAQVSYSVVDNTNGALLIAAGRTFGPGVFSSAVRPRVIATAAGFILGHINTATNVLEFRFFDPTVANPKIPTAATSSVTLTNVATPNWDWDLDAANSQVRFAYNSSTATTIRTGVVSNAGVASGAGTITTSAAPDAICMTNNGGTNPFVAWHDATAGLSMRYLAGAFTGSNFVIDATATVVEALTAVPLGGSPDFCIVAQYTASGTTLRTTVFYTLNNGNPPVGGTGANKRTCRAIGLLSKAFVRNNRVYVFAVHSSPLQSQVMLIEAGVVSWTAQPNPMARVMFGEAFGLVSRPHLPSVSLLSTAANTYAIATLRRERTFVQGKQFLSTTTPGEVRADFTVTGRNRAVEIAESLTIAGGFVGEFDGAAGIVEQNFFMGPEIVSVVQTAGAGSIADGTYQYVALYEWTDAKGKLHRSQPSVPVSIVVTGGGGIAGVTVTLPTLRETNKDPQIMGIFAGSQQRAEKVQIAVYRTASLGSLFFRTSFTPSTTASSLTADTVTFVDVSSDATISSHDLLYTTGGILPFWSPNSCSAICATADRVFVNDLGDPGVIYFSNKVVAGEPVEFSQALFLRFGSGGGGKVTALSAMDDKIAIWKLRELWITSGQGPDGTGQFGSFADVQKLPFDGGADSQASVVTTPMGIIAKGPGNGFNLLGRDLSWTYIGAAVRTYDSATVVSSVLLTDVQEVRFVLSSGTILIYNYQFLGPDGIGQWSVTNFSALDACYTKSGRFYALESSSRNLYVEDPTIFYDFASSITDYSLSITTAWIMTSGIQGFQCVKRLLLLGDIKDTCNLQVEIAYDFSETWDPTPYTIAQNALGLMQIAIQPRTQKCQAIRFRISDPSNIGGATRENYDITAMTMLIGLKPGTYRTTAAQRAK
jgi:hypothetical protein